MKISFIGFGNMAKAIADGLLRDPQYHISAAAPSLTPGKDETGINTFDDNLAVLADADVVVLAVKPLQMNSVYQQIHPHLPKKTLVISIAAGIPLSWFAKSGVSFTPVVRAMPNIASALGLGATPLIANDGVSESQRQAAEQIFNMIGITTWVTNEDELNAYTALSGSGPAYVFLFMEGMIEAATSLGLEASSARRFALQTVNGALNLAEKSQTEIADLRRTVTSPNGTTAAALAAFETQGFKSIIKTAMQAAVKRAESLQSEA